MKASKQAATGQLFHLIGTGGIGKTTLARQMLYLCRQDFAACIEIRIDSITIMEFAKRLSSQLQRKGIHPPMPDCQNETQAKAYIHTQLNQQRLLLLLDNVGSDVALLALLPQSSQSSILITSRDRQLSDLLGIKRSGLPLTPLTLKKFTHDETLALFKALLRDKYQSTDEQNYIDIATAVDFLPIALSLAITTMLFGDQLTAKQLLKKLQQQQYLMV